MLSPDKVKETITRFKSMGYTHVRHLEDDSFSAILPLMYTTAICMGMNDTGYESRFCFERKEKALEEFEKLTSADSVPSGFIARR